MSPPNRAIVKVDSTNAAEVADVLKKVYSEKRGKLETCYADEDVYRLFYISTSAGKDEGIILQVSADATATIFQVVGKGGDIATVDASIIQAKVATWAGLGAGVCISANLINAKASVFDLNLGVGVSTGAGIRDDSIDILFAGCGFKLGRKVGVSAFDNYFGIDFGRCCVM